MAQQPTASQAERDKLRGDRKLSLVSEKEEGTGIDFIPAGTYGFTYSPSTEGVPLFRKHTFQVFEVHKLFNEHVHFVGYMTAADAQTFHTATDAVELKLYPEPFGEATVFVSVPHVRILRSRPVSREQGNYMPFLAVPDPNL